MLIKTFKKYLVDEKHGNETAHDWIDNWDRPELVQDGSLITSKHGFLIDAGIHEKRGNHDSITKTR